MNMKIVAIREKRPVETTLPDGMYSGSWGGNIIEVRYQGKIYELETEEGVRGIGFKVVVTIKDGIATFSELANE
jgi:hypothetical protein